MAKRDEIVTTLNLDIPELGDHQFGDDDDGRVMPEKRKAFMQMKGEYEVGIVSMRDVLNLIEKRYGKKVLDSIVAELVNA